MCITEEEVVKLVKKAIEEKSILLYFQPIYNVGKSCFTSAEILSRIVDEKGDIVSPALFIPIAESKGLICDFGFSIFESSCKFIKTLGNSDLNFSINISPLQLLEKDFADRIIKIITNNEVSPEQITMEITESVTYELTDTLISNVFRLEKYGFKFSLDDMGKGASDLFKASRLPLKTLKIDKMYIENIESNNSLQILVKNMILYANSKSMSVVAEGVENVGQKNILESLKCHYLQGFYFSKPLPDNIFIQLICQRKIMLKFPVLSKI
jgi:EAL domain-containing protein (putative c-di-GMP-specific phosphodiesterase class I)